MRKVLILSNKVPYPAKDGSSIAMARLLENLIEMGDCSITYGAINTVKHRKKIGDFPPGILASIRLKSFEENTSPTIFNGLFNLLFTKKPFNTVRFHRKSVVDWLNRFESQFFDTVILEGAFMGDYLHQVKSIGKTVVLRAHNLEHVIWERSTNNTRLLPKRWYFRLQARRLKSFELSLAKNVDSIWSLSPVDALWFKQFNSATFFIPVSVISSIKPFPIEPKKCFFLGALDWLPNLESVEWFIEYVWPIISRIDPTIEFHLAGNNPPQHLKNLNLTNVFVHGRVPDAKEFSMRHGISVIPLLSGSGVRIKLLENGSYGVPTVSTSVGAEGIYGSNTTKIPIADDAESFAKYLVELCSDTEKATEVAKALHEDISRRFSSANSIEAILSAWPN